MFDVWPSIHKAQASTAAALDDLQGLMEAAQAAQAKLESALATAQRAAALSRFNPADLQEFLTKPYLTRPLGDGQYELIVPSFIDFRAGWPVRHVGAYSVFLASRFIHFINPLPDWLAGELGFGRPSVQANLEGNTLTVTRGDAGAFAERLGGSKAIARRDGNTLYLRPSSRFDILRRIIREEGFLPFSPRPVPRGLRRPAELASDAGGQPAFSLRPHQARDYQRFLETGAVSVFAYPQTGKSFLPLQALAELSGPKLILCPRRSLVDQWRARLQLYLTETAAAEVTVTTYQGANKHLDTDWTLVVFDEAHHIPADFAIDSASRIRAEARIGLSATPRREDGNEDLIPALCGFPVGADWPVSASQRPPVTVWIVRGEAEKLRVMRQITESPVDGKTFVFTYRLDIGEKAAKALGVPFVYSKTKRPLEVIDEADTVVISSIGNEGLSFPVRRVIEIDFLYGSGMEAGQRLGRLAYEVTGKDRPGQHHILMTLDEYQRYAKRLLIYEQWGLDIDIRTPGGDSEAPTRVLGPRTAAPRPRASARPAGRKSVQREAPDKAPADEIDATLAVPAIAIKIAKAEEAVDAKARVYIRKAFRACSGATFSALELVEGQGLGSESVVKRYRAAFRALADVGLLVQTDRDRYTVAEAEVQRLKKLASLVGR